MDELNWSEVFDAYKFMNRKGGSTTIFMVNEFLSENTVYEFFCFNGMVFRVRDRFSFVPEESYTGLTADDIK